MRRLGYIALLLLIICGGSSCSKHYKLLKSDDAMAKYEAGLENYKLKKYDKAKSLLDGALTTLVGTAYEDTILFTLGKAFYESKDYGTAGELMNQYRNKYPRSPLTPEAEYIYAMSFYMLSADVEKDQTDTRQAIVAFGEYINRYPDSRFVTEIEQLSEELYNKLYYKKYLNAALYYKLRHYLSAVTSLKAILKNNPETPYREDILYLVCKSWFDYAKNSIYSKQLDRYLNTIDAYYDFVSAFPESKQFGRELGRMKDIAQDFVDKNGVTSQSIESSITKIADATEVIAKSKDAMYSARSKAERISLRARIKDSREIIKVEKAKAKEENKVMKENQKKKLVELKALEKSEKEAKKAEENKKKEARKERVKKLKEEHN